MRDALQFKNRAECAWVDVTHGLAEGAFFFHVVGRNDSLQNDLSGRGHFDINGLTFDKLHRFAGQSTSESQLVYFRRNFLCCGIGNGGNGADNDRDFQRDSSLGDTSPNG